MSRLNAYQGKNTFQGVAKDKTMHYLTIFQEIIDQTSEFQTVVTEWRREASLCTAT